MVGLCKRTGLSVVLAGTLGASANAVCVVENYCIDLYLGAGGFYENTTGSGANINNMGGFISLGGADVYFKRVQFGLDVKLGYGSNSVGGTNLNLLTKDNTLFQFDGIGKIGVNIAGKDSPLFVNFLAGYDVMNSSGVGRELFLLGGGIDGKITLNEKMKLTYTAGYGYVFNGAYTFNKAYASIGEGSQIVMFSLGTQAKVSENVNFYFKGFGKYYDLNASKQVNGVSMPDSRAWQAGLEAGVAF
ncbi:hypothetical protein [Helicobacter trogontum]|uniref:Outer membrane beta-barrel protein n=1 Tax=Helicobacter trogontum TaxID=50960 RepID=A0A4U8THM6_9HELI|nr:hypothetical protein [Helicobacter trogontum]TLD99741.1 hypothetical protein LS80_000615 [Helicobacter trogontum]